MEKKLRNGIVDPIRDNILKKYQSLFHSFKFSAVLVAFTVIFGTLYSKVSFAIVRGSKTLWENPYCALPSQVKLLFAEM